MIDTLLTTLRSMLQLLPRITFTGLIEIAIIAFITYQLISWCKNTRAFALMRGLLFILGFVIVAAALELDTILWIMGRIAAVAVMALIIIFQPELRKALEQLGSRNFIMSLITPQEDNKSLSVFTDHTVGELVKASYELGKARTGALMVIEDKIALDDIVRTGIDIDAIISSQLLINIFEHNTPLHDGAVIIRGNTIVAATCYLPLSENMEISKDLGTRHRAAIGISEVTDSLTIVVSEETGNVSVAKEGRLTVIRDPEEMKNLLRAFSGAAPVPKRFKFWKGKSEA